MKSLSRLLTEIELLCITGSTETIPKGGQRKKSLSKWNVKISVLMDPLVRYTVVENFIGALNILASQNRLIMSSLKGFDVSFEISGGGIFSLLNI